MESITEKHKTFNKEVKAIEEKFNGYFTSLGSNYENICNHYHLLPTPNGGEMAIVIRTADMPEDIKNEIFALYYVVFGGK